MKRKRIIKELNERARVLEYEIQWAERHPERGGLKIEAEGRLSELLKILVMMEG